MIAMFKKNHIHEALRHSYFSFSNAPLQYCSTIMCAGGQIWKTKRKWKDKQVIKWNYVPYVHGCFNFVNCQHSSKDCV